MAAFLDADGFRSAAQAGRATDATLFKFATTDPQIVQGAARTRRFVFSDASIDRAGDSIDPKGWQLDNFRRNPVALWAHDSSAPPIGKASGVAIKNNQLVGDISFPEADVYEFSDTVYRLIDGGYIKAVSVGFRPLDWKFSQDKSRPNGINFIKQELCEISIVPVPCHPGALIEARAAGVDTRLLKDWAGRVLDEGHNGPVPRRDLEAIYAEAGDGQRRTRSMTGAHHTIIHRAMDDVTEALSAHRTTLSDLRQVEKDCGGDIDKAALGHAIGHTIGAISSHEKSITCLKAALSAAPDPSGQMPTDAGPAKRIAEAARLQRELAAMPATTPEERRREVANLTTLAKPTKTRAERVRDADELRRSLRHQGLI